MTNTLRRLRPYLPDRLWSLFVRLSRPHRRLYRLPLAVLLIIGGLLGFLPVLGLWMLPVGLLLLSIDLPAIQPPLVRATIWVARKMSSLRRRRSGETA